MDVARTHLPILEQSRRFPSRILIALGGLVAVVAVLFGIRQVLARPEMVEGHAFAVPDGENRIVVEVLNGTDVNGLARAAARVLRRGGIDVVTLGGGPRMDSTVVLVRRGNRSGGDAVRRVLGVGWVREQRDSTRHVDVTVILGPDFVVPDELHP